MKVTVHEERVFALIDLLMERQRERKYPFNRSDAIVPQAVIPAEIRKKKRTLALFYFFVCVYMRGGIESLQAFKALFRLYADRPWMFEPHEIVSRTEEELSTILKQYVGWDAKTAGKFWRYNAQRLIADWGANPLNLLKGLTDYDEALRRIANARKGSTSVSTVKKTFGLDTKHHGFAGFQAKMVSMLIYFYDWERWLQPRFLYPAPADFHHYRLNIAYKGIVVATDNGAHIRYSEKVSAPYREVLMRYLEERKADPILVADAIWLFSLLMCGNSPATRTKELGDLKPLFRKHGVDEPDWDHGKWLSSRARQDLQQTCGVCALQETCDFAVPSHPYYRKGQFVLRPRRRLPFHKIVDFVEGVSEAPSNGSSRKKSPGGSRAQALFAELPEQKRPPKEDST